MKISYNWLQSYFSARGGSAFGGDKLPKPEKLAELLTMHSFEVEQLSAVSYQPSEKKKKVESRRPRADDYIFDIDISPNRAHDCLSHIGVAREVATILNLPSSLAAKAPSALGDLAAKRVSGTLSVSVKELELCRRYIGRIIEGVKVKQSPKWLRERLEAIGQKSINNIVDATNYVMFETGQPLHAFDADKVEGGIVVRKAKKGERITTLDGREVELDKDVLVIADEKEPLAIAGIKGGKKAEVDENTKNIILEAANFEPVNIRKTSRKIGIRTESSLRFENEITSELAGKGMNRVVEIILDIAHGKMGAREDIYPRKANKRVLGVHPKDVSKLLGIDIPEKEIIGILQRLGFSAGGGSASGGGVKKINPVKNALKLAKSLTGKPYKYGASVTFDAPREFDCSSFTSYIFAHSGVSIPRMVIDQYFYGEPVDERDAKPGDLVFSNSGKGKIHYESKEFMKGRKIKEGVDHVGIYLGKGKVIHASRYNADGVAIEDLKKSKIFKGKNLRGFRRVFGETDDLLRVTVPFERLDVRRKEDLIEEIGRIYGYGNIPSKLPEEALIPPKRNDNFFYADIIRGILTSAGFSEVYNYSFVKKGNLELANPIAKDKKFLRTNLADGLKENIKENIKYFDKVKIFELGKIFPSVSREKKEGSVSDETVSLALIATNASFFEMKGTIESILDKIGITDAWFDDSESGISEIMLGNTSIGNINDGEAEISFDMLVRLATEEVEYRPISKYPAVKRDISVFTPLRTKVVKILDVIENTAGMLLVDTDLFDIYEIPDEDRKSSAFHLVFQSQKKTLSEDEINKLMNKIMDALDANVEWQVRRA